MIFLRLTKQKEDKTIKAKKLNDELQKTAGIEADAKRLDDYEKRAANLKDDEKKLTEEKRIKLADAWQELLQPKIQKQLKELEYVRDQQISKLRTRESIRAKLSNLQTLLR